MKNFSYLATIAATTMAVALPSSAGAQGIFQRVPKNTEATTTIYAPPIDTMTAPTAPAAPSVPNGYTTNFNTTTTTVSPGVYPSNHSFGKFSNYGSFSRYKNSGRNGRNNFSQKPRKQQKMILNPDPMYPGFNRPNNAASSSGNGNHRYSGYSSQGRSQPSNSCSTNVIGSPIPSAVPLDRSGRPCN